MKLNSLEVHNVSELWELIYKLKKNGWGTAWKGDGKELWWKKS